MSVADRFRRWYRYEREVHALALASFDSIPEAARADNDFHRAVDLMAHLAVARRLWLFRMGGLGEGPADLFPRGMTLDQVRRLHAETESAWAGWMERLDEASLARTFSYRSLEGTKFRSQVEDVLAQLFGHSSYHRGQVAMLVRRLGGTPAVTDFIFWSREPSAG